jgi:hypothetical protein
MWENVPDLQGCFTLRLQPAVSPKRVVPIRETIRRHIPENSYKYAKVLSAYVITRNR